MVIRNIPNFNIEQEYWRKGFAVIGMDESGRGAFAGPLTVAGVVFPNSAYNKSINTIERSLINDSKKLSSAQREKLDIFIRDHALFYDIFCIDVPTINTIGIQKATERAARHIFEKCKKKLSTKLFLLMDGFKVSEISENLQKRILYGDTISLSIAAASIIAKVHRDKIMCEISHSYPDYGFHIHKGYGTTFHRKALKEFGPCNIHRTAYIRKTIHKTITLKKNKAFGTIT